MNYSPIAQKILRIITRSRKDLRDLSSRQWTLSPAQELTAPPAIWLPDDLDRVTAVMEDTNMAQEMARIHGGPTRHAATTAYEIKKCSILDGSIFKGPCRLPLTKQKPRLIMEDATETIPAASLASTYYGSFYFGHWMTDDLTLQLAAESNGNAVSITRKQYGHEPGYCELLGFERRFVTNVRFDSLTVFEDIGQNASKRDRYLELRGRLERAVKPAGNARVYIRRGTQGAARNLRNAEEIENWLAAQGFVFVEPENATPAQIVQALSGAQLVLGLEGSHMVHCLFTMATAGTLCLLQPPYRFNNVLKNYTDCLGMRYSFVTGTEAEGGFIVSLDHLQRLLDLLNV